MPHPAPLPALLHWAQEIGDQRRELAALGAFFCVMTALTMASYRRTLD